MGITKVGAETRPGGKGGGAPLNPNQLVTGQKGCQNGQRGEEGGQNRSGPKGKKGIAKKEGIKRKASNFGRNSKVGEMSLQSSEYSTVKCNI